MANGTRTAAAWLHAHGHRGPGEFDLAAPRWREQPDQLREMADRLAIGEAPLQRFKRGSDAAAEQAEKLRAALDVADAREFDRRLAVVHRFMPFREEGKDYLMLAYDELRRLSLEMGRRLDVGNGVFHLQRDEVFDALRVGFAPLHVIEQRQRHSCAELTLTLPRVIDATAIDRLGKPADFDLTAGGYRALAISAGRASGPARVLRSAADGGDAFGEILVCPSTDPAWTPLFVNAVGLVLECGGTLSHGAVVAREMGLPAVVVPDATRLFRTGDQLDIDGNSGWVGRAADAVRELANADAVDSDNTRIPCALTPPPPGAKDRRAAAWRTTALGIWALYLLAFFLLPRAYVHQPSLALLDIFLWPMVRAWGKPAVVALVSVAVAALTVLVQKLVTGNRAMVEAQRRAAMLVQEAKRLPEDSPRRRVMTEIAAPVSGRLLMARLVPVCLLLGPMILPFVWFKERLDPSVPGAPPGFPVQIVATVDGEWTNPLRIEVPSDVALDETTPATRTLPPLRRTLEHLLTLYRQPESSRTGPWELQVAPDVARMQTERDLERYLDAGLPPQGVTWTVRAPAGASRRFPVSVVTEGYSPVGLDVVLGGRYPPGVLAAQGAVESPVKELRVVYPKSSNKTVFWQPFAALSRYEHSTLLAWLAAVNIGWLWLYVVTYFPALAVLRAALRVA